MLIPTSAITDWRNLQDRVAQLFREMGYVATSPKLVELAGRGKKEVDVHVEDPGASVNQVMLVECKFWEGTVDQETVHAMHTVMIGAGANTGFVISKSGFQSGAFEATAKTNIHLLTWEELQHKFGRQWYAHQEDHLELLMAELRANERAHLDQFNPLTTAHSNMFFRAAGTLRELFDVLADIRLALSAVMARPKAYDAPGPIEVHVYEGFPGAEQDKWGLWMLRLASVREYFAWVLEFSQRQLELYRALQDQAHAAFDELPDQEGEAAFRVTLREIAEDTPIRVFRERLGADTYERLLADHLSRSARTDPSAADQGDETQGGDH